MCGAEWNGGGDKRGDGREGITRLTDGGMRRRGKPVSQTGEWEEGEGKKARFTNGGIRRRGRRKFGKMIFFTKMGVFEKSACKCLIIRG